MDPLTRLPGRGFRREPDSLPGLAGEVLLAQRAPLVRYIVAIDGVVGHVDATDHEAAAQDAAETYWLASEIRERVIVEVVEPVSAGGARHLGAQSAGLTPSVRPLREAAGRPEQGAA